MQNKTHGAMTVGLHECVILHLPFYYSRSGHAPQAKGGSMSAPCKIELVAQVMGLTPTNKTKNEWRYGSKGSLALDLNNNQFYDHEIEVGGGVLQFIIHKGHATNDQEAYQFLKDSGLISEDVSNFKKSYSEQRHHIYLDENGNWLRKATKFTKTNLAEQLSQTSLSELHFSVRAETSHTA